MAVVLIPHRLLRFTIDATVWAARGDVYLRAHVRDAVWSIALVFVVAVLLAYGLYWLRSRRRPAEFSSQGDVWIHGIGRRPKGMHPYVALELNDGRLVEGLCIPLHSARKRANVTSHCPSLSESRRRMKPPPGHFRTSIS